MIVNIITIYIDIILTRYHCKKGHYTVVRVMSLNFNNNSIFIYYLPSFTAGAIE